jgi:hypothetical protein
MPTLAFELPIDTLSELNTHEHWTLKARRVKRQRREAHKICLISGKGFKLSETSKIEITLTRLAPRTLDSDNLVGALKAVRDGVADWLGIDDGSDRIIWNYNQEYLPRTRSILLTITILED